MLTCVFFFNTAINVQASMALEHVGVNSMKEEML